MASAALCRQAKLPTLIFMNRHMARPLGRPCCLVLSGWSAGCFADVLMNIYKPVACWGLGSIELTDMAFLSYVGSLRLLKAVSKHKIVTILRVGYAKKVGKYFKVVNDRIAIVGHPRT